jgi:hypothetical protein
MTAAESGPPDTNDAPPTAAPLLTDESIQRFMRQFGQLSGALDRRTKATEAEATWRDQMLAVLRGIDGKLATLVERTSQPAATPPPAATPVAEPIPEPKPTSLFASTAPPIDEDLCRRALTNWTRLAGVAAHDPDRIFTDDTLKMVLSMTVPIGSTDSVRQAVGAACVEYFSRQLALGQTVDSAKFDEIYGAAEEMAHRLGFISLLSEEQFETALVAGINSTQGGSK